MSKHRLLIFLSLPVTLVILLIVLVFTQQTNLSKNLSTTVNAPFTVTKWTCDVTCDCFVDMNVSIGTTDGEETICSNLDPSNSFAEDDPASEEMNDDDCNTVCQKEYPDPIWIYGAPKEDVARANCKQTGICSIKVSAPAFPFTPEPEPTNDSFETPTLP